jgi:hypothetical protein
MKDQSVLIVGLVRDAERSILKSIKHVDAAFSLFRDRQWLVIESDSSDRTVERLHEAARTFPRFEFRTLGKLQDVIPERTRRIAHCRNAYLKEFRTNYQNIDLLAVADLDGINDRLTGDAVASCFTRERWSACTASQSGPYYDIYALRHAIWCPDDWWTQHQFARDLGIVDEESIRFACHSKMLRIPQDAPWIEVDSAFGGLTIYRGDALLDPASRYDGVDENGRGVCEHVPFHRALRRAGHRIFINPRLVNASYTEHTWELVGRRELRYIRRSLGRIFKARTAKAFARR